MTGRFPISGEKSPGQGYTRIGQLLVPSYGQALHYPIRITVHTARLPAITRVVHSNKLCMVLITVDKWIIPPTLDPTDDSEGHSSAGPSHRSPNSSATVPGGASGLQATGPRGGAA